jgi:hypothetical protein
VGERSIKVQNARNIESRRGNFLLALALVALLALGSDTASATVDDSRVCEAAATRAAAEFGVPRDLLLAVALAESGRQAGGAFSPWPWTINEAGRGRWFPSRQAAESHVESALATGARNIDIGCFQINHRWHAHKFETLAVMFDPVRNAGYAAGFLAELYRETGDWMLAAGAYHSRTPELAERYRGRVAALRAGLTDGAPASPWPEPGATNGFALLQPGSAGAAGSLVPHGPTAGPLLARAGRPLFGG